MFRNNLSNLMNASLLYFKNYLRKAKSIETTAAVSDIGQHLLELVLITTGHVCKVSYKQLGKHIQQMIEKTV
ncbi:hypothetical protein pipiens_003880 [Culex pipiens pipiens]|uniref:Transposase n=1 Tax=Culex pipiens pipiens TaxID=38569 RepID=A0ABD1CRA0_CULPP